jgi:hypothetical protein
MHERSGSTSAPTQRSGEKSEASRWPRSPAHRKDSCEGRRLQHYCFAKRPGRGNAEVRGHNLWTFANGKRFFIARYNLFLVLILFGCVRAVRADGGRLRFREAAGPFIVTLFTTPDPLTKGRADFSLAVNRAGHAGLAQDAHITLILTSSSSGKRLVLHASHAAATSKWLQAVNFSLPARGYWRVAVIVREGDQMGHCSGQFKVRSSGPRDLLWDVLAIPLGAVLFLLHQNRKRKYRRALVYSRTASGR